MTSKASETGCLQASFRTVRGVRAENLLASFTEPTTTAKHEVRAAQSESDEVANDLHYTALELVEIKSEQVLATNTNKKPNRYDRRVNILVIKCFYLLSKIHYQIYFILNPCKIH